MKMDSCTSHTVVKAHLEDGNWKNENFLSVPQMNRPDKCDDQYGFSVK